MTTPKTLNDISFQDNVIHAKKGDAPETHANGFFHELFDPVLPVTINLIFQERESDTTEGDPVYLGSEMTQVYEAYQDGGSIEYLYIICA